MIIKPPLETFAWLKYKLANFWQVHSDSPVHLAGLSENSVNSDVLTWISFQKGTRLCFRTSARASAEVAGTRAVTHFCMSLEQQITSSVWSRICILAHDRSSDALYHGHLTQVFTFSKHSKLSMSLLYSALDHSQKFLMYYIFSQLIEMVYLSVMCLIKLVNYEAAVESTICLSLLCYWMKTTAATKSWRVFEC